VPPGGGSALIILRFFYAISKDDRDGFIDKNDNELRQLILRGYIDEAKLARIVLPQK